MADQTEDTNLQDDPAIEDRARHMGWVEKERFRGPDDKWVDAATFVRRGEEILPIIQSQNRKLQEATDNLRRELAEQVKGNKELRESIGALNEFHEENLKEQVARVRTELRSELREARKEGDVDKEMELEEKLRELDEKAKKVPDAVKKTETTAPKPAVDVAPDAAFDAWRALPENSWFGSDRKKTALALEIGREVAEKREASHKGTDGMPTAAFYLEVARQVNEFFGDKPAARTDKVSGARTTRSTSDPNRAKTFEDLPDDAKAVCSKQADKLVGPNKVHKDLKSWQSKYAELYWKSVSA
jgi:hypothetical protein